MQRESTNVIIHGKHDRQYRRNIKFLKIVCCIVLFLYLLGRLFIFLNKLVLSFRVECKALWNYLSLSSIAKQ